MEKRELFYTVDGNANWHSHYGEQCGDSLKNRIELPYDPAIPLLGIHTEETRIERDMCTPMFTAALFTVSRTRSNLDIHGQKINKEIMVQSIQWNIAQP